MKIWCPKWNTNVEGERWNQDNARVIWMIKQSLTMGGTLLVLGAGNMSQRKYRAQLNVAATNTTFCNSEGTILHLFPFQTHTTIGYLSPYHIAAMGGAWFLNPTSTLQPHKAIHQVSFDSSEYQRSSMLVGALTRRIPLLQLRYKSQ